MDHDTRPHLIQRLIMWLRAGYPQGIPHNDYIALFGVLHRTLTPMEVDEIAFVLHEANNGNGTAIPQEQIREFIQRTIHEKPSETDVRRVTVRLAEGGWPLATPPPE